MATTLKNAKQQAATAAKEERARDAALAMQEYEAEKLAIGIKTARACEHSVWGKKLKVTNARRGRIRKRSHRSCEGATSSTASPLSWKTRNRDCSRLRAPGYELKIGDGAP